MADYRLTQTGQQVQNDLNNAENDHTTLANHVGDSSIHVTPENKSAWNAKYDKPGSGIPKSDLASGVQTSLGKADTAYQKPGSGIPSSDMTSAVQTSLGKADSAYQKPGTGIPKSDMASAVQTSLGKADSAYQKPNSGIPQSDMDSSVQAKLNAAGSADQAINQERSDREAAVTAEASARQSADQNLQTQINAKANTSDMTTALNGKVDKVTGKGLSTNDYTDADKAKLGALPTNAELNTALAGKASTGDVAAKYTKPSGGIPKSDLASGVQTSLGKADTAYQKPNGGVPKSDLASAVQTTLDKADNAAPQSTTYNKTEVDNKLAQKQNTLTFDQTPTNGSANPVTSDGVYDAIKAEETARQNADASEVTARNTAIQNAVANEASLRIAADQQLQQQIGGTYQAASQAATAAQQAQTQAGNAATQAQNAAESAQAAADKLTELQEDIEALPDGQAVSAEVAQLRYEMDNDVAKQNGYYKTLRSGLSDNLVDERPFTEMGQLHMTASSVSAAENGITYPSKDIADGQSQVLQLMGNGAAFMQLYPCGTSGDFSADADCPNDLPVRYSDNAGTTEMGYLDLSEVLLVSDLTASDCALLSAILTADAARGCTTGWLDEAGNELAVSVSEGSATWTLAATSAAVTPTKVVRRAIRVKASEANRGSESWWFTSGSTLRQIRDMAVKEGIDVIGWTQADGNIYGITKPFDTCSLADWIHYQEAKEGTVGIESQNAGTLEGAKLFQLKVVTSANLLDPETGVAELAWYKDEGEGVDGRYTIIGLPAGATLSLESKVTGLTSTPTVDAAGHLLVGGHSLLHITSATGLAGCSVIATYDGSLDQEPADEYAAQVLSIDVTKVYGKLNGEGEYVQVAAEGLRGYKHASYSIEDVLDLVNATSTKKVGSIDLGDYNYNKTGNRLNTQTPISDFPSTSGWAYIPIKCAKFLYKGSFGSEERYGWISFSSKNLYVSDPADAATFKTKYAGTKVFYPLDTPLTYTSLIYRQSGQPDIPLSQLTRSLQVCNWATTKAVCAAATETTVGSTTSARSNSASPVVKSEFSSNIPEQVDSLDARVTALEQAIANMSNT